MNSTELCVVDGRPARGYIRGVYIYNRQIRLTNYVPVPYTNSASINPVCIRCAERVSREMKREYAPGKDTRITLDIVKTKEEIRHAKQGY